MSFRFAGMLKLLAGIVVLSEPLVLKIFGDKPVPNNTKLSKNDNIEIDVEEPMIWKSEDGEGQGKEQMEKEVD